MALYTPHLTSPKGTEIFNLGTVTITWDINDPPSDESIESSTVTHEIEYTEDYKMHDTLWHTLKRRIPFSITSYTWQVGKMIKSETVRVRIRSVNVNDERSDWSMSGGNFSINVFKLRAPAIVSPIPNNIYTDYILIILDETLTLQTFHQKVRYTIEYSSKERGIDWTVVQNNIPVGRNVIRWNIEDILPSNDYQLKLTAQDSEDPPHQIATTFVYNLNLQNPGTFLIDTKPPESVLEIEGGISATNRLDHVINIFAEDETTQVEKIQLCERNTTTLLSLGNTSLNVATEEDECPTIDEATSITDLGKPVGYSTKTHWNFRDESGFKKLEAILTDTGGNTSLDNETRVFLEAFSHNSLISDFLITTEQREYSTINTTPPVSIVTQSINTEVIYVVTLDGYLYVLEPFPRLMETFSDISLYRLNIFEGSIYIFAYSQTVGDGYTYRYSSNGSTLINTFTNSLSIASSTAEYNDELYVGFQNGELWRYNGFSFTLVSTLSESILTLYVDANYLYIGCANSSTLRLYDGTSIINLNLEPT